MCSRKTAISVVFHITSFLICVVQEDSHETDFAREFAHIHGAMKHIPYDCVVDAYNMFMEAIRNSNGMIHAIVFEMIHLRNMAHDVMRQIS